MIIENTSEKALIDSRLEVSQGFMAMTPELFKILISDIYTQKILAVIREVSCNGWDGHIAAGKTDTPLTITFPNSFQPWFSVRDYGTGLDEDFMRKLYIGLGVSTKRKDSSSIGGFGIGCKSPLCYADIVTVSTFLNGIERQFSFYLDEGIPALVKVLEHETTEPNGVLVTVPVKDQDIHEFSVVGKRFLRTFKDFAKVTVKGIPYDESVESYKVSLQGDKYKIVENIGSTNYAVMGGVAYGISPEYLSDLRDLGLINSNQIILIDFPIGALEVAASRETLQYTEKTINYLVGVISEIVGSLREAIQKEFNECKTYRDFVDKSKTLVNNSMDYQGKWSKPWVMWKGKDINYYTKLFKDNRSYTTYFSRGGTVKSDIVHGTARVLNIYGSVKPVVLNPDILRGNIKVASEYAREHNVKVIYEPSAARRKFLQEIDGVTVVNASEYYEIFFPKAEKALRKTKKVSGVFMITNKSPTKIEVTEIDINKECYYLEMFRNNIYLHYKGTVKILDSSNVHTLVETLGLDCIYLVRKAGAKMLTENIKPLSPNLDRLIKNLVDSVGEKQYIRYLVSLKLQDYSGIFKDPIIYKILEKDAPRLFPVQNSLIKYKSSRDKFIKLDNTLRMLDSIGISYKLRNFFIIHQRCTESFNKEKSFIEQELPVLDFITKGFKIVTTPETARLEEDLKGYYDFKLQKLTEKQLTV